MLQVGVLNLVMEKSKMINSENIVKKKIGNAFYLFLIADAQDYFDINPSTGEILLVNSALSRGNRYTLLVKVGAL